MGAVIGFIVLGFILGVGLECIEMVLAAAERLARDVQ